MIIDAFPFFNEVNLLNVRLEYLGPYVDKFIIIESNVDFSGKSKELLLTKEYVQTLPYSNKIEVINWSPESYLLKYIINISSKLKYRKGLWLIQNHQRNYLIKVLKKCKSNDILIFGDLDEFPDVNFLKDQLNIEKLLSQFSVYVFKQELYYYSINNLVDPSWRGTILTNVYTAIKLTPKVLRKYRIDYPICAMGWHFSYFGDSKFIKRKIRAIADVEKFSALKDISETEISHLTKNSLDIYGRSDVILIKNEKPNIPSNLIKLFHFYMPNCS